MSPAARQILEDVSAKYGVTVDGIRGKRRSKSLVFARHEAAYRLRTEARASAVSANAYSLPAIGKMLNKHHSTIIHAIASHKERMRGNWGQYRPFNDGRKPRDLILLGEQRLMESCL